MFIRYFAQTDDTDLGKLASLYCDALIATGIPVRLCPTRVAELQLDSAGRCSSIWARHRGLLTTPMVGYFANVVCGTSADWAKFWTASATNVMLIAQRVTADAARIALLQEIRKYDRVFVPNFEIAEDVDKISGVIPSILRIDSLRTPAMIASLKRAVEISA